MLKNYNFGRETSARAYTVMNHVCISRAIFFRDNFDPWTIDRRNRRRSWRFRRAYFRVVNFVSPWSRFHCRRARNSEPVNTEEKARREKRWTNPLSRRQTLKLSDMMKTIGENVTFIDETVIRTFVEHTFCRGTIQIELIIINDTLLICSDRYRRTSLYAIIVQATIWAKKNLKSVTNAANEIILCLPRTRKRCEYIYMRRKKLIRCAVRRTMQSNGRFI